MSRRPYVAGHFYPSGKKELNAFLEKNLRRELLKGAKILEKFPKGLILPHAGYVYSGLTAARTLSCVALPNQIVILGPNHTGSGEPFSTTAQPVWETPLGEVRVDQALAGKLKSRIPFLEEDDEAHRFEHCIEVELPFLQYLVPEFSFVPIVIGTDDLDLARQLGNGIADVIQLEKEPVLVITSSDMNHYESDELTRRKDQYAIQAIMDLDEKALAREVKKRQISMCGFVPAYSMLVAVKKLGAKSARLIDYRTSADASGDKETVVGYAGIVVE